MSHFHNQRYSLSFGGPLTPAVKGLLIANICVYLLQSVVMVGWQFRLELLFGLVPVLVIKRLFLWQPVTYLFLHGDILHILFNMLILWMFGSELEKIWGPRFFLRYYFISGVGAGLLSVFVNMSGVIPTIGASGAIYGLLLAYGMWFPTRIVYFMFIFPIQMRYFVIIIGFIAFYSSLLSPGDQVAHIAHLGGMIFGYLYLKRWDSLRRLHRIYLQWKLKRLKRKFHVINGGREEDREDKKGPTIN
jgi:membrane associated rhomboid family serine protease